MREICACRRLCACRVGQPHGAAAVLGSCGRYLALAAAVQGYGLHKDQWSPVKTVDECAGRMDAAQDALGAAKPARKATADMCAVRSGLSAWTGHGRMAAVWR